MAPGSDALSQDAGPSYGRPLELVPANKFSGLTGRVRPKAEADCTGKADLERPFDPRVEPYSKGRPCLPTEPAAQTSVPLPLVRKE